MRQIASNDHDIDTNKLAPGEQAPQHPAVDAEEVIQCFIKTTDLLITRDILTEMYILRGSHATTYHSNRSRNSGLTQYHESEEIVSF